MSKKLFLFFIFFLIGVMSLCIKNESTYAKAPLFIGEWIIGKEIKVNPLSSSDQAEDLFGKHIKYYDKVIISVSINDVCVDPIYETREMIKDDFEKTFKVTASSLGINTDIVTVVRVLEDEGKYWKGIGNRFIVKNYNSLILESNLSFFRMVRN